MVNDGKDDFNVYQFDTKEKKINEQMLAQTISEILKKGLRKEEKKNE